MSRPETSSVSTLDDRLELAIQEECAEIKRHPTHPDWHLCRRNQSWITADVFLQSHDHAAAAEAAREMAGECTDQWQECYDAACLLARCSELACVDPNLTARERVRVARSYANDAIRFLKCCIKNGFADCQRLRQDADLAPLREHRAFKSLIHSKT